MARTTRLFECPPEAVFAVLADGWTYPSWVVGASRMRGVDEAWPEPGSSIRHSVGVWPALIDDETTVVEWDAPHRAAFTAKGWPIGEARIIVEVRSHARGCVVRMHEYALRGPRASLGVGRAMATQWGGARSPFKVMDVGRMHRPTPCFFATGGPRPARLVEDAPSPRWGHRSCCCSRRCRPHRVPPAQGYQ